MDVVSRKDDRRVMIVYGDDENEMEIVHKSDVSESEIEGIDVSRGQLDRASKKRLGIVKGYRGECTEVFSKSIRTVT